MVTRVPGDRARSDAGGHRFADVRWVAETGSTNADLLDLARAGEPEGIVLVADHQTAGTGPARDGRWEAPPGCVAAGVGAAAPAGRRSCTLATTAWRWRPSTRCGEAAGVEPRASSGRTTSVVERPRSWPGSWPRRTGRPARRCRRATGPRTEERTTVVVGIGMNVNWPARAARRAGGHRRARSTTLAGREIDREDLLVALLGRARRPLRRAGRRRRPRAAARSHWRARSATLGRQVRVELGGEDVDRHRGRRHRRRPPGRRDRGRVAAAPSPPATSSTSAPTLTRAFVGRATLREHAHACASDGAHGVEVPGDEARRRLAATPRVRGPGRPGRGHGRRPGDRLDVAGRRGEERLLGLGAAPSSGSVGLLGARRARAPAPG